MHYPEKFRVLLCNNGVLALTHTWWNYIDNSGAMDFHRMFELLYMTTGGYSCPEMLEVDFDNLEFPEPLETFGIDCVGQNAVLSEADRVFDERFDLDWLKSMCVLYFNGIHVGHIKSGLMGNPNRRSELALEIFRRRLDGSDNMSDQPELS